MGRVVVESIGAWSQPRAAKQAKLNHWSGDAALWREDPSSSRAGGVAPTPSSSQVKVDALGHGSAQQAGLYPREQSLPAALSHQLHAMQGGGGWGAGQLGAHARGMACMLLVAGSTSNAPPRSAAARVSDQHHVCAARGPHLGHFMQRAVALGLALLLLPPALHILLLLLLLCCRL